MGSAQVLANHDTVPNIRPRLHSNVVPLCAPRVQLKVFLTGKQPDSLRVNLATLLHSPLGVYVSQTEVLRDSVCVRFNIDHEDLDFILHLLITTMSEATIGAITRPGMRKDG
ncbi:hypothetical protein [Paraburkholderia sp. DGU8]|jgi:hypothetical protein|uniref:hypothetical protein n=1 Tax=Paraburkholderia sp. DGU8 TaxID=3161997 RepID=UPI003466AE4C